MNIDGKGISFPVLWKGVATSRSRCVQDPSSDTPPGLKPNGFRPDGFSSRFPKRATRMKARPAFVGGAMPPTTVELASHFHRYFCTLMDRLHRAVWSFHKAVVSGTR